MTGMPILHLRARVEPKHGPATTGWSSCGIASMWFDKDYSKPESMREADLYYSVKVATDTYLASGADTAWNLHESLELDIRSRLVASGLNELTAGFGIALVDAAIMDAVCRMDGLSFHAGLKAGALGFDPELASLLPTQPIAQVALRHTVGLGDPLVQADVEEAIGDGLPQTLEEVIDRYGCRYFNIKVNSNIDDSLQRLRRIAAVVEQKGVDYQATLDGNEAFADMESFVGFAEACAMEPALQNLWQRTLWIEQPVARQQALEDSVALHIQTIAKHKPIIVDESDATDEVIDRALELGYRGISAKNCKGIYRTLKSFIRVKQGDPNGGLALSSEDLTNQPIVSNHQDLCVAAALGIRHSERNGHHFFKGFQFLSERDRAVALKDYPSLYEATPDGIPTLKIKAGEMSMIEVNGSPGLGVASEPDWTIMQPFELPKQSGTSTLK